MTGQATPADVGHGIVELVSVSETQLFPSDATITSNLVFAW